MRRRSCERRDKDCGYEKDLDTGNCNITPCKLIKRQKVVV